ncbi:COP9 signalosome complex subunit 8 [Tupaia chinensis]|uniref:COP9 signalosome complex subunit 8 n=1 Tax=Tupaia chinensis TaxID=246437 RepID=L9KKU6_TUPCH|nr:COP9 signalosome complex subunit 8 [Tupaia chinensis]
MPVAVMAEGSFSFKKLLDQCENQELEANSELGGIWSVGQRIWQRDFPGIYTTINAHQWSETVQPIMEALREATRRRAFALVSQAYTSIVADDFAAFVGLPVEEAVKDSRPGSNFSLDVQLLCPLSSRDIAQTVHEAPWVQVATTVLLLPGTLTKADRPCKPAAGTDPNPQRPREEAASNPCFTGEEMKPEADRELWCGSPAAAEISGNTEKSGCHPHTHPQREPAEPPHTTGLFRSCTAKPPLEDTATPPRWCQLLEESQ